MAYKIEMIIEGGDNFEIVEVMAQLKVTHKPKQLICYKVEFVEK